MFATPVISCIPLNTSPHAGIDNNQTRLVDSSKSQPRISPIDLMLPRETCSIYKLLKIPETQDKHTSIIIIIIIGLYSVFQ